jgi:uncharacterized membrane protein YccC
MTVTVDLWALVGAMGTLVVAIFWLVYLELRYRSRERDLKAHEDLCAERYAAIEARSAQLVKASDDRHEENIERFHAINRHLERQDDKLDRLLERVK